MSLHRVILHGVILGCNTQFKFKEQVKNMSPDERKAYRQQMKQRKLQRLQEPN